MPSRGDLVAFAAALTVVAGGGVSLLAVTLLAGHHGAAQARRAAAEVAPNHTMSGHVSTCVRPKRRSIPALTFDGRALPFRVTAHDEPRCRGGALRILRLQPLVVRGEVTFVRRGGCDRPARGTRCSPQPTAHVRARDLALVEVDAAQRNGNGAAVSSCPRAAFTAPAAVGRELDRMFYKRPSDLPGRSVAGAVWSNYGNPGRRFGPASTSYLLWNLPRTASGVLPGGGIVEAVLAHGQRVMLCDVPGLSLPSFDARGRRNGRVRFLYAAVAGAGQTIYGWVMRGYAARRQPFTSTLALAERGAAGATVVLQGGPRNDSLAAFGFDAALQPTSVRRIDRRDDPAGYAAAAQTTRGRPVVAYSTSVDDDGNDNRIRLAVPRAYLDPAR